MLPASRTILLVTFLFGCGDTPSPTAEANRSTAKSGASAVAVSTASAASATSEATASAAMLASAPSQSAVKSTVVSALPPAVSLAPTAVASASEAKGEETKGGNFSAYLSQSGKYKAGQPGVVTAVVNALGDYKVNQEYPYKFTLNAAPAGVSYGETVIRNVNRSDKRASMSIPFTPSSAGTVTISGVCSLSVCTASNCQIEKVPLSVTVKVE